MRGQSPLCEPFRHGLYGPHPPSQILSQSYDSSLPTSLTYILPCTRGCSPWRPDAVSSTLGGWALPLAKEQHRTFPEPRRAHPTPPRGRSLAHSPPRFALQQLSARWGQGQSETRARLGARPGVVRPARVAASGPRPSSGIFAGCPFGGTSFRKRRVISPKDPP